MGRTIGVMAAEHVAVGLVEGDRIAGAVRVFPEKGSEADSLRDMPADEIAQSIRRQVELAAEGGEVSALGVGVPGVILGGVVAESPNLQQIKGLNLEAALSEAFPKAAVRVLNDAAALAAGIAATRGELDRLVRGGGLGAGSGDGGCPRLPRVWGG